jgi:hypothetical protein
MRSGVRVIPLLPMHFIGNLWPWWLRLGAILLAATGVAVASERWETLQAINWVENPRNSPKPGPRGELGPYQFRPSTWRSYTTRPFALALERRYSDEVAVRHYEWIKRGLQTAGIDPIPYNIALAWNAGLEQVVKGRAPASAGDYASRVNNLVEMLKARTTPGETVVGRPIQKAGSVAAAPDGAENQERGP